MFTGNCVQLIKKTYCILLDEEVRLVVCACTPVSASHIRCRRFYRYLHTPVVPRSHKAVDKSNELHRSAPRDIPDPRDNVAMNKGCYLKDTRAWISEQK